MKSFLILVALALPWGITAQTQPPVYVVLFTHIEDNTPAADIGTPQARIQYITVRNGLLAMAAVAKRYNMTWVFQPDWKVLLASLAYEDSLLTRNTAGKNVLRYLREDMGVPIDAHSHEKQGYNYTDVAHLLDSLGVGGSTVIGGHVWDPSIPQFQGWDRFRLPVAGTKYPWSTWRGNILMGSGTPNHVNDPCPSGVWRPKDRYHYWEDDSAGNIYCIGQFAGDVLGVQRLVNLYRSGAIRPVNILTASFHIKPAMITAPAALLAVEDTILKPLEALRARGEVEITDFTSLIDIWKTRFGAKPFLFDGKTGTSGGTGTNMATETGYELVVLSHPVVGQGSVQAYCPEDGHTLIEVSDLSGRRRAVLSNTFLDRGTHSFRLPQLPAGVYIIALRTAQQFVNRVYVQL